MGWDGGSNVRLGDMKAGRQSGKVRAKELSRWLAFGLCLCGA